MDELSLQLSDSEEEGKSNCPCVDDLDKARSPAQHSPSSHSPQGNLATDGERSEEDDMFGTTLSDSVLNQAMEARQRLPGSTSATSCLSSSLLLGLQTMSSSQFNTQPFPPVNSRTRRTHTRHRDRVRTCDTKKKVNNYCSSLRSMETVGEERSGFVKM